MWENKQHKSGEIFNATIFKPSFITFSNVFVEGRKWQYNKLLLSFKQRMQATTWIIILTDYPVTQNVKIYVPWMTAIS